MIFEPSLSDYEDCIVPMALYSAILAIVIKAIRSEHPCQIYSVVGFYTFLTFVIGKLCLCICYCIYYYIR